MTGFRFDEHAQSIIEKSVVPIGVFQIVDEKSTTVAVSEGLCRLFGYNDPKEAAVKMDSDPYWNVHPDDVKSVTEAAEGFEKEDSPFNLVYRIMTGDDCRLIHACGQHTTVETGERLAVVWYMDEEAVTPDAKAVTHQEAAPSQEFDAWEKENKDPLTGLKNKHSFDSYIAKLQNAIDHGEKTEVAIGVFNCDDLNRINERYGQDKGNLYLKASCMLVCKVFKHSPVFRIGGEEFAVILQGEDYHNIDELLLHFQERRSSILSSAKRPWEKVSVSFGIAVYCPQFDPSVKDLIRRADQMMYDDKSARKALS